MTTFVYQPPPCLDHLTGPDHPESPERLRAVDQALQLKAFFEVVRAAAPRATVAQLQRMHHPAYIESVFAAMPEDGEAFLDADTVLSPGSGEAALRAAGAVCDAVDEVLAGSARNAFCAVRPPGHHAMPDHAMGFCLFNNVAVAAAQARAVHGLDRVAVVDFDVHHGNGTQAMFWDEPGLFYGSSHQHPCFPGTGRASETGVAGNIVNVDLAPGAGSAAFRAAWSEVILPALNAFAPELVLISAGFDAHARDPLGQLRLTAEDFGWVTTEIVRVANARCAGRVVSTLEGGYDLPALAASVHAHVEVLTRE